MKIDQIMRYYKHVNSPLEDVNITLKLEKNGDNALSDKIVVVTDAAKNELKRLLIDKTKLQYIQIRLQDFYKDFKINQKL